MKKQPSEHNSPKYPEIGARLGQFIAESGEPNARQFALRAGLTAQVIAHLLGGNSMPSGETLTALSTTYRTFDSDWLLTGRRKATVTQSAVVAPAPKPAPSYGAALVGEAETLAKLGRAEVLVEQLSARLAEKDGEIKFLRGELGKSPGSSDAAGPFGEPAHVYPPRVPVAGFELAVQRRVRQARGASEVSR